MSFIVSESNLFNLELIKKRINVVIIRTNKMMCPHPPPLSATTIKINENIESKLFKEGEIGIIFLSIVVLSSECFVCIMLVIVKCKLGPVLVLRERPNLPKFDPWLPRVDGRIVQCLFQ